MLRHTTAVLSLLLFLFAGQASVQGYVWCLGENGHSEIEVATNDKCGPQTTQAQRPDCHDENELFEHSSQDDHCGPCLDIPHSIETTSRNQKHKKLTLPIELAVADQALNPPLRIQLPGSTPYLKTPPRVSQTILLQRTVVLLN